MAHPHRGVEGSSLSLDVPKGMDARAELLARHCREAREMSRSADFVTSAIPVDWLELRTEMVEATTGITEPI